MADKLEIVNRALQRIGAKKLTSLTETSREKNSIDAAYDNVVSQELMTNLWTFAIRRKDLTADSSYRPDSVVITAGGAGYAVGDKLTVSGGTLAAGGSAPVYRVDAVDGSGAVTGISLATETIGYSTVPTNPAATTNSGSGDDNCTLTITYDDAPPFGRAYRYLKPFDYLRAAPRDPHQTALFAELLVEGRFLLSDYGTAFELRYVSDLSGETTPEALFHPLFANAVSMRLASEIAEELVGSSAKLDRVEGAYLKFVSDARRIDAIEQGPIEPEIDEFVGVRISSSVDPTLRKYS